MKQESYIQITNKIRKFKYGERTVIFINRLLTDIVYIAFLILLVSLLIQKNKDMIRIVLITGVSFALVSIIRHFINAQRPYAKYDFVPLISKEKKGDSMPSRHVFSAFIIGMAYLYVSIPMGIVIMMIGVLLATVRVIAGVHFPKDVIAGAAIGIILGIIGFYVI